jgi:alpha-ribazole phosphatase
MTSESLKISRTEKQPTISHRELEQMNAGGTRLYLVRHGELVTSQQWLYVGHMDVELNDTGRSQISRLAQRLSRETIDVLLASNLSRTMQSAEIIGNVIGLKPQPDPAFREVSLGQWEGLSRDQIIERYPEDFEQRSRDIVNYRIAGGESFADLRDRVIPRLKEVLKEHQGKNLLLVAHGGANRIILCHALGLDLTMMTHIDQAYGCLNIIDFFDGMPVVRLMNELPLGGAE